LSPVSTTLFDRVPMLRETGVDPPRGRLYDWCMQRLWKQFTLDRLLLLSIIGLAVAAHFLPVLRAEVPEGGPERNVFGWQWPMR
jgi:hypothetical protein